MQRLFCEAIEHGHDAYTGNLHIPGHDALANCGAHLLRDVSPKHLVIRERFGGHFDVLLTWCAADQCSMNDDVIEIVACALSRPRGVIEKFAESATQGIQVPLAGF